MEQQKLVSSEKTNEKENICRDEPELRFPDFFDSWRVSKLGEISTVTGGKRMPKGSSLIDEQNNHPYITVSNMNADLEDMNNFQFVPLDIFPQIKNYIVDENDLIISVAGTLGLVKKVPKVLDKANLTENANRISEIQISGDYLYFYLNSNLIQNRILSVQTNNAQPKLALKEVRNFKIKYPSNKEQKKIANLFLRIDKKIELLEKKHQLFKDFKNYSMQQIFSSKLRCAEFDDKWDWLNFKDIFKTISTKKYQIKSSEINEKGLYEVVDQGQQDIAGYNDDNSKLFMKLPIIVYGDHTTFVKYRNSPFIVGADGVKLLSLAINADMKYMYYALDYFNIKPEGYKRHFSIIKKIDLPIPSLNEQKYISSFFSKLDDEINFLKLQIENTKRFKKGLLQKMFV